MSTEAVTVYLGLGSNLGDPEANLKTALGFLAQRVRLGKVSSKYDTAPIGNANQPRFLNLVCQASTFLPPAALLAVAKGIESKLGRVGGSDVPRTIDIDILLYGSQVIKTDELTIPHPRMTERAFVLMPLAEITPDVVHPGTGKTIKQLLDELKGSYDVVKLR